jgi:hypothetical protein
MNQFKLTGTINVIGEKQQVSDKFSKREFVVTINREDKYPQDISMQMTNDKCDVLNSFMEGQDVEVSFNLRGRAWTNPQGEVKYFNTLEAWRIELSNSSASAPTDTASAVVVEDDGDLPF